MLLKFFVLQRSSFLEKEKMHSFVHFPIVFSLFTASNNRRNMSSNVIHFQTSGDISPKATVFLLLIFFKFASSYSFRIWPGLMCSWLLIIFYMLSVISGDFRADSWNFISTCEVFLPGWQLLVLLSMWSSFSLLHLLFAKLIMVAYLQPNFRFYWMYLTCSF